MASETPMVPVGLVALCEEVVACRRCPRLAAYLDDCRAQRPGYWSRPVPSFGDADARLLILGLAPAYHGGNQHGRVFTGDQSGAWLWSALHGLGAASAPDSPNGRTRQSAPGIYITNTVRCVPPGNRPTGAEIATCVEFLRQELALLPQVRAVLALGRIAHEAYVRLRGEGPLSRTPFAHGAVHRFAGAPEYLVDSYHPSRQNTNTGVLTREMWLSAIGEALRLSVRGQSKSP